MFLLFSFFLHLLNTYIFGFFATFVLYELPMFLFFLHLRSIDTYMASLQHLFSMSYLCFFSSIYFFIYSLYTYIETFVFFALPMFFSLSFFIYSLHTYLASSQHLFSMHYLCFFLFLSSFTHYIHIWLLRNICFLCVTNVFFLFLSSLVYSLYKYIETFVFL